MISALPKLFGIDVAAEKAAYEKELQESAVNEKKIKDGPLDFMVLGLVAVIGILIGNIKIPLGGFGEFSLGAAGGILVSALIFSYIGKIGPINFRMDQKALGILYQTGLTFFMAVVGLRYGYDVVNSPDGLRPAAGHRRRLCRGHRGPHRLYRRPQGIQNQLDHPQRCNRRRLHLRPGSGRCHQCHRL